MKKFILSLAIMVAPLGLTALTSAPASAQEGACYVDGADGGLEPAPNFQDEGSCYWEARGYWM